MIILTFSPPKITFLFLFFILAWCPSELCTQPQTPHQYNLGLQLVERLRVGYHLYPQWHPRIRAHSQHRKRMTVEWNLTRAHWKGWDWFYRDFGGLQGLVSIYISSTPRWIEQHMTSKGMSLRKQRLTSSGSWFGWKWETQVLSKQIGCHRGHKMGVVGAPHDSNLISKCFGAHLTSLPETQSASGLIDQPITSARSEHFPVR